MSEKLTTSDVAQRLNVSQPTVKLWCRQGKFPHAVLEQTARGPLWQIPESDLKNFAPPKAGRPPASKSETASTKKRTRKAA